MDRAGQYILSVALGALLVAIVTSFSDSKSSTVVLLRMVCGLFLAFTVIKPIGNLDFDGLTAFAESYAQAGDAAAAYGENLASDSLRQLIKEETQAYILDKAHLYQCDVRVEVTVGFGEPPVPESVQISGSVTPFARRQMEQLLEEKLGIPKENQIWIG